MTVREFADRRRLRIRLGEDREPVIAGKRGHIYEHDTGTLGVLLEYPTARRWNSARRKLEAAGFVIWQDGDTEGTALFDPENAAQVKLALKVAVARPKRVLTPEQLAARLAALEKARQARSGKSPNIPEDALVSSNPSTGGHFGA